MKKIFWILVVGALGSAAMAMGFGKAETPKIVDERVVEN